MKFNIIEGRYIDFDSIHDDFVEDYLLNTDLSNTEIRRKYELSNKEFWELANQVKEEFNITRRPKGNYGKYYTQISKNCFGIQKSIKGRSKYLGVVPTEEIARVIVGLCKKAHWDIDKCKYICKNWKCYV